MEWVTSTQLLQSLKASADAAAWEMFHRHFSPLLVNFARRLGLPEADAQDAAQETMMAFLKAFRHGHYDRTKGRLGAWLFGVARKVVLNARQKLPRERQIADATSGNSFWDLLPDDRDARMQDVWQAEWRQMILKKSLDRVRRECDEKTFNAFELYAISEMPAQQVAERLNLSKNAVYIAKNRVLSRLRQIEAEFEDRNGEPTP